MMKSAIDWDQLLSLRSLQDAGEPDVVAELIVMFGEEAGPRLSRARAALDGGDADMLRLEAHALRGTAGVLGATAMREACHAVEDCARSHDLAAAVPLFAVMLDAIEAVNGELAEFSAEERAKARVASSARTQCAGNALPGYPAG